MTGSGHRAWQLLLAILVSGLLLWWAFHDVDFREAAGYLRSVRPGWLLAAVVVATSLFPLRLFRWRLLLRREDGGPYPFLPLWHAIAMGFAANNLLPFRAGEVVRTVAASRLTGARFTTSLASVAVERVFDALTMVGLLGVALLSPGMPATVTIGGISVQQVAASAGLLALAALAAAGAVVAFPRVAERTVRRLVPSDAIATRLTGMIDGVRLGFTVLRSPARLAGVVAWSIVLWLVNALSFYLAFLAFDLPVGYPGAVMMQGVLAFGIAIPSAPGFVGPFEAVITAILALYGIGASQAVAYAVGYHLSTFFPITLLGIWSAARTGLGLRRTAREAPADA
ncbi:MAG TPA: lysylphosphatidylglycerol synthase transmembrane domain-containing protein [Gemmatimonadales bacterium]|nr:lysylphosphatidylglycerol synthase transmembrane domain-containing protein [Gemmatimonadales bacterium]